MNRRRRARAVIGAAGAAAFIWVAVVPLFGHRLVVTGGPPSRERIDIGLVPVMVIALAAALVGWGLLAVLERLLPRAARRVWTVTAVTVLLLSLAPLFAAGMSGATRITLGAMHVAVAAVLIPIMTRVPAPHLWEEARLRARRGQREVRRALRRR